MKREQNIFDISGDNLKYMIRGMDNLIKKNLKIKS